MVFKLGTTEDLRLACMPMLVSMALTLMQGHSVSTEGGRGERIQRWILSTTKQAIIISMLRYIMSTWPWLSDKNTIHRAWPSCCFSFHRLMWHINIFLRTPSTETAHDGNILSISMCVDVASRFTVLVACNLFAVVAVSVPIICYWRPDLWVAKASANSSLQKIP